MWQRRVVHLLGQDVLGAVALRTEADIVEARRLTVIRGAMFVIGVVLALVFGAGWVVFSILAAFHFLLFSNRTALVAVIDGLAIVRLSALRVNLVGRWPVGEEVTVTARPAEDAIVHLASWNGMAVERDLEQLSLVVSRGGGALVK